MDTEGKRIKYIIDTLGVSQNKFSENAGLSSGMLTKIIAEKGGFSGDSLQKLVKTYNINANWLLTGNGDPFILSKIPPYRSYISEEPVNKYEQSNASAIGFIKSMPSVRFLPDMMISAGYAEMLASNQTEMLPVSFSPTPEELKKGVAVEVYGDSMEPAISEGAIVFLMPLTQSEWLRISKGVFVFDTDSTLTIKRIAQNNLLGTPATITLQADNPKYPNLTFNAESINAIWKVTHILNQPVN